MYKLCEMSTLGPSCKFGKCYTSYLFLFTIQYTSLYKKLHVTVCPNDVLACLHVEQGSAIQSQVVTRVPC